MYSRIFKPPRQSYFLFGPRGTGKSTFLKHHYPDSPRLDLLDDETYTLLLTEPKKLSAFVPPGFTGPVIIDEIQKLPHLLDEVHRLMEDAGMNFVLTGSSARKLKRAGVNLLAGRALTEYFHPLTVGELGRDFDLAKSIRLGHLPMAYQSPEAEKYLASYVRTYMDEEVKQEGYVRNLASFSRFLQAASLSQAGVLNVADIARDCAVERKVVENYFSILEDLLLAHRIPVFAKKAKRRLMNHAKFFFFDVGVYQSLRPKGPLDSPEDVAGAALETLVFQEILALNRYRDLGYGIHYWRTSNHDEVDLVLYGRRGLVAIEIKRSRRVDSRDLKGLRLFLGDYPVAKAFLLYGGTQSLFDDGIFIRPLEAFLKNLEEEL